MKNQTLKWIPIIGLVYSFIKYLIVYKAYLNGTGSIDKTCNEFDNFHHSLFSALGFLGLCWIFVVILFKAS